ncbi:MAG: glutathione peroxidase, partial [Cycloclasticus sp.]
LINAQPTSKQLEGGQLMSRLAEKGLSPAVESDVSWNFEKFLVARDGSIKGRFAPDIKPDDTSLINAIEEALKA